MGYIYLRKNLSNGKCYVGQTIDVEKRNYAWKNLKKEYGGHAIENARKKYGTDGFSFEILKECPNEDMNYWEKYYVKEYNSKIPYGYNSTDGGDSIFEMTDETRKKIGDAQRGKPKPKVAAALRGRKLSEETKKKMSDVRRGKSKPKVADALRGRKRPDIAAALKGRKQSPEHVARKAASKRGVYNTKKSKAVQTLNPKTLEVIYEFPSTREAERQGFNSGCISQCCRGKLNIYKGYIWRYSEK